MPSADISAEEVAKMTLAARSFTRYGYADFFQQGSTQLLFRLWPGTQRHLLSGDPALAAAVGRTSSFCGAAGLELMEPLTFKGRDGSGAPGGRCAYADAALTPTAGDWQKFEYYYRVWGRHLYNPDADPESYRRYLPPRTFGSGPAPSSRNRKPETALAKASRVLLPLLTSAHLTSASNRSLWIELPTNMPIVLGSEPSPYSDTPTPKIFATVSPLDPQLFSTITDHVADLLAPRPNAKYSPIEVAQWLEDLASTSNAALAVARKQATSPSSPEFRRMEEDVLIQIGLARFYAGKMRSATLFEINRKTGNPQAGQQALAAYKQAREAWATMATRASHVYVPDITYGEAPVRHGHWLDRIPAIDTDIAAMQAAITQPQASTAAAQITADQVIRAAIADATGKPTRPATQCAHTAPTAFHPGQPLSLTLSLTDAKTLPSSINLLYRHVNQAERWHTIKMDQTHHTWKAAIPADYTHSPYPLQYYFELTHENAACLHPAFNATLSNQPYFAIWKRDA